MRRARAALLTCLVFQSRVLAARDRVSSAQVLISMGDFSKGLEYLKQAAALDPECPIPYVNAARAYLGMNDINTARRQARGCVVVEFAATAVLMSLLFCFLGVIFPVDSFLHMLPRVPW